MNRQGAIAVSSQHVSSAIAATAVRARELGIAEKHVIIARLRERIGIDVTTHAPWDSRDNESIGQQQPDGWMLIAEFVDMKPCLMFLEGATCMWEFQSGKELLEVLSDCPPLELYVCDVGASYLLCHNHHDFVIGWGAAREWVDHLGPAA